MAINVELTAADLERILLQKIADNTLKLPAMREVVMRCMALLSREDLALRDVARAASQDPVLVGRILSVSNSAAFAGTEPIRTVLAAVTRLGVANLKTVLFEAAAHQVFDSADQRIRASCRGLWIHSRAVAILAREIARYTCLDDLDDAYLGGLLHDIGKPVVASLLLRSERVLLGTMTQIWFDADSWIELVELSHRAIGIALSKTWNLPATVVSAISNCSEYDEATPRSVPNCIRLANALAKEEGFFVGRLDRERNDGVLRTGQLMLGLQTAEITQLRESLRDRVQAGDEAG
jgi:HD-like signal output (HDOD) protein